MLCLRDLSAFICVNYECMMYVYLCLLAVQGAECEEELLKHVQMSVDVYVFVSVDGAGH